ncbi:sensor domain-containing protein [Petroclostridium xylanilyticum]|uniref:sensor domain-containing protein n=1 Tax=Petroclostridium xylanilyticum TaxID=1792311 RepID=UPI000B991F26|nr:EAL domain-containing protein [Petroclostridium xylanilyticum]
MQSKDDKIADITASEVIEYFPLPFYVIEGERIILCNQKAVKVFGYEKKEELLGLTPYSLSPASQPDGTSSVVKGREMINQAKESGYYRFRWVHQRKCGRKFLAEVELFVEKGLIFATVKDIEREEKLKNKTVKIFEKMKNLVIRDFLTGLYNKKYFMEQLDRLIQASYRTKSRFALLFIDVDNFKEINDTLGHQTGDRVIEEAARRLKEAAPENCLLARYGGDEFAIIVSSTCSKDELYTMGHRLLQNLKTAYVIDNHEFYLSASIGIACYPADGEDAGTLLKNADIAMYKAKETRDGKYNIRFFEAEMEKEIHERFLLENHLKKALEKEELILNLQPIVNIIENRQSTAEALVRWENEVFGLVPPDKFIPLAEETGLIHEIGTYVLKEVCRFIQSFRKKEFNPIPIAINISLKQLENRNFTREVENIIASYGIEGKNLEFEITESVSTGNMEVIAENLRKIKGLGIKIAMDDFGTGYSSLAMLLNLEVDKIKIDKIFINNIRKSRDEKIIRTVISMAKELGLTVIVEGVETEEQVNFLKNINCEYGQGYFWAKPMQVADFEKYLQGRYVTMYKNR